MYDVSKFWFDTAVFWSVKEEEATTELQRAMFARQRRHALTHYAKALAFQSKIRLYITN